jgi:hypothetical protein
LHADLHTIFNLNARRGVLGLVYQKPIWELKIYYEIKFEY